MRSVKTTLVLLFYYLLFGVWTEVQSTPFTQEEADSVQKSIQTLRAELQSDPENFSLHYRLGHLCLSVEKWDSAMESFQNCISLNDTSAEAYNALGLVYYKKGKYALLPLEALFKLLRVNNYNIAEKNFKRALKLRPDYIEARYNFGMNWVAKGGDNNYKRALEALKKVIEQDSTFRDADLQLGIVYFYLGELDIAESVLKNVTEANRTAAKAMIQLSELYMEKELIKEATHYYYDGVMRLRDPKVWNKIYSDIRILMEEEERKRFENLPIESKGNFIRKFWKRKDPTPTTEENERLTEHHRRVMFARENYSDIVVPYYDDRGKVYVKYGPPDNKFVSQIGAERVKDNESWSYEKSIREGLTFDFVKKGSSYQQVQDLSDAASPGLDIESRMTLMRQLYYERAGFTESYNRFLLETEKIDQSVMVRFESERSAAQKEAPAEFYHHKLEGNSLPFFYSFAQFRGSEGRSRTEVYVAIPHNRLKFSPGLEGNVTSLDYHLVVHDSDYVDIYRRKKKGKLQVKSFEEIHNQVFLWQENFELFPGKHVLAIRVENPQGDSRGVYSHEFEARDFRRNDLMISDIQLASDVDSTQGEEMFVKRGLKVIPYPFSIVQRRQPIFVYFEIYNLKYNVNGKTDYTVTHAIDLLEYKRSFFSRTIGAIGRLFKKSKKAGISTSYRQTGLASSTVEYLSFDMEKLPQGVAQMTIGITDNSSGEMASQDLKFRIIE